MRRWYLTRSIPSGSGRNQKTLQIAYMPRKRPLDATTIRFLFPRRFPGYAEVPWVALEGMHRDRIAEEFGRTAALPDIGSERKHGFARVGSYGGSRAAAGFHGDGDLGLKEARDSALWVDRVEDAWRR